MGMQGSIDGDMCLFSSTNKGVVFIFIIGWHGDVGTVSFSGGGSGIIDHHIAFSIERESLQVVVERCGLCHGSIGCVCGALVGTRPVCAIALDDASSFLSGMCFFNSFSSHLTTWQDTVFCLVTRAFTVQEYWAGWFGGHSRVCSIVSGTLSLACLFLLEETGSEVCRGGGRAYHHVINRGL